MTSRRMHASGSRYLFVVLHLVATFLVGTMRTFRLALLLLVPTVSAATDISVGGVELTIPSPNGFGPVTQQMTVLFDMQKQFVAPTNEEFVTFIPELGVPAAMEDEVPDLTRRFTLQTAKALTGVSVSTADFMQIKNVVKSQNDELIKKVENQLPGLMEELNDGIAEKYDVNLAFSVSQMVPMPVHAETNRTLAYSALVNYSMNDENGNATPFIVIVTATFVHVRGKVLFLYSYAEESALDWSREASNQWAAAVVAANPPGPQSSMTEALPRAASGIDWEKVGIKAAVGAIIGLIVGLIGWAVNRGKAGRK